MAMPLMIDLRSSDADERDKHAIDADADADNIQKFDRCVTNKMAMPLMIDLRSSDADERDKHAIEADADADNIQTLFLSESSLAEFPTTFVEQAYDLRVLHLATNLIPSIPSIIANLQKLRYLSLNNNLLTSLPYEFSALVSLEILDISNNKLARDWPIPELANIKSINISNNQITTFYVQSQYPHLEMLNATSNCLSSMVPAHLGRLTMLLVADNQLSSLPSEWVASDSSTRRLKQLLVNSNPWGKEANEILSILKTNNKDFVCDA